MITKQIIVKRVYNLGNYENRSIERTVELNEGDDADTISSELVEKVERDVRQDWFVQIEYEIKEKKDQIERMYIEINQLRSEKDNLRVEITTYKNHARRFLETIFSRVELIELCGLDSQYQAEIAHQFSDVFLDEK